MIKYGKALLIALLISSGLQKAEASAVYEFSFAGNFVITGPIIAPVTVNFFETTTLLEGFLPPGPFDPPTLITYETDIYVYGTVFHGQPDAAMFLRASNFPTPFGLILTGSANVTISDAARNSTQRGISKC